MLISLSIALLTIGAGLLYLGRLTPAQRRQHVFWAPVVLFGLAAALVFISETPDGAPGVFTRVGFMLFVVFAGLAAGFGWLAQRYAVRKPNISQPPDPDTPMDMPWSEEPRAA